MRLQPFIDQLVAGGGKSVEGALEFAGLVEAPRAITWYVVPDTERAQANSLDALGAVDQQVSFSFTVVVVIPIGRLASKPRELLEEQKRLARDALVGWTHPDGALPVAFTGGSLMSADGQTLAWRVGFTTTYHYRKTS